MRLHGGRMDNSLVSILERCINVSQQSDTRQVIPEQIN